MYSLYSILLLWKICNWMLLAQAHSDCIILKAVRCYSKGPAVRCIILAVYNKRICCHLVTVQCNLRLHPVGVTINLKCHRQLIIFSKAFCSVTSKYPFSARNVPIRKSTNLAVYVLFQEQFVCLNP